MSLDPSLVTWVLPTKGDVDLAPILASLPPEFETIVYDGSVREDFKVFGRYVAMLEATRPVIATQDDDCIVRNWPELLDAYEPGMVVGNMRNDPARLKFYRDTTMLGWGSIFDAGLPWLAFSRFARFYPLTWEWITGCGAEITFPMLTRSRSIPVEPDWLGEPGHEVFARADRMSNQPGFYEARDLDLKRAREVRDRLAKGRAVTTSKGSRR